MYLTRCPFPYVTSVAATRFFDKCYATAALGRTVVLVGGFRDRPANRRVRRALAQRAPGDSQDAMILLTFPGQSFPAGTVLGWPESPDADEQEHPKFSMHVRFGVPTQPSAMDPRQVNRHANLAKHPCNTQVILFSPRPSDQAGAITPGNGCITSRRRYTGYLYHTGHAGIDSLSCGVSGRIRHCRFGSRTSLRLRFWTPSGV